MRAKLRNALVTIAKLAKMEPKDGFPMGEAAKDLTEDEAARIGARLERSRARGTFVPGKRVATAEPARNEPCPCKSGKKYKRCCGFVQPSGPSVASLSLAQFKPGIRYSDKAAPTVAELETKLEEIDPAPPTVDPEIPLESAPSAPTLDVKIHDMRGEKLTFAPDELDE